MNVTIEQRKAADGYRWRAIADNGEIVAESGEAYSRKTDLRRALKDLASAVLQLLACVVLGAMCLVGAGCTSTKISGPDYSMKRITFLQKSDIKSVKLGNASMEGYRNDGGSGALEAVLAISMQYMGLQGQLQEAKFQQQLQALQQQLDARPVPVVVPPVVVTPPGIDAPSANDVVPGADARDEGLDVTKLETVGGHHMEIRPGAARIVAALRGVDYDGRMFRYDRDDSPRWSASSVVPQCNGRALIAWMEGSRAFVAHFDWIAADTMIRDNNNLMNDYLDRKPPIGAPVWMGIMAADGGPDERFNFVRLTDSWQG